MLTSEAALAAFDGRTEDLKTITRYVLYPVMFYRTNLWIHSRRVAWLVHEINPIAQRIFGDSYDPRRAELLALVHDDPEIFMGDIPAGNKGNMTAEQLEQVRQTELASIEQAAARFPEPVDGYNYRELLIEAATYASLESQVVQFADKFDALGEALHEIYGGNVMFASNAINQYGKIPTPSQYYYKYFDNYLSKFPRMTPLLAEDMELFQPIPVREDHELRAMALHQPRHNAESFAQSTGYWPYDIWKGVTMRYGNADDVQLGLTQTELPITPLESKDTQQYTLV